MESRHLQFDAFSAVERLRDQYVDFLCDRFRLDGSALGEQLRNLWRHEDSAFSLFSPHLIQGAFPFVPGQTPAQLQSPSAHTRDPNRPLHPKTVEILNTAGIDYRLYEHQTQTIQAASEGKTVVLSAGTGSGKTEAFLIPLLDRLFWDHSQGLDDLSQPGVRAIILYPLNALVNNQTDRLQALLRGQNQISFAYYTSRLRQTRRAAEKFYSNRNQLENLPTCQIIDRETLRGLSQDGERFNGPPHILVTNFSMLQYMLVRPADRTIFRSEHLRYKRGTIDSPRLKAIVLDEAHAYAGAMAAEIHMLLRRTAMRFGTRLDAVQGLATSATLSAGGEDDRNTLNPTLESEDALRIYAAQMFSKPLNQVVSVVGHRWQPPVSVSPKLQASDLTSPTQLAASDIIIPEGLQTLYLGDNTSDLTKDPDAIQALGDVCLRLGIAQSLQEIEHATRAAEQFPARFLYALLSQNSHILKLRAWLFEQERIQLPTLDEVATQLYGSLESAEGPDRKLHRQATHTVLRLASMARLNAHELPLIPARMHAFVRAPAGVWVSPRAESTTHPHPHWPWGRLSASPSDDLDGEQVTLLTLVCEVCGAPYLQAFVDGFDDTTLLARQPEEGNARMVLLYRPQRATAALSANTSQTLLDLPSAWGGGLAQALSPEFLNHNLPHTPNKHIAITHAPCCGCNRTDLIPLEMNPRNARGVIVDALYPHLGEFPSHITRVPERRLPGGGRRLMTFSDSRQETAKVAVDIEDTHDEGLARALIWQTLNACKHPITLNELIESRIRTHEGVRELSAAEGILHLSNERLSDLCRLWVYREFAHGSDSRVLERLGLVEVIYPGLENYETPDTLKPFLSPSDWRALLTIALDNIRRQGAIIKPSIQPRHQDLAEIFPYGAERVLRWTPAPNASENAEKSENVWLYQPKNTSQQALHNYLDRLRVVMGDNAPETRTILDEIWKTFHLIAKRSEPSMWWLSPVMSNHSADDFGFQINLRSVQLVARTRPQWIDPASRQVYHNAILGVSPQRYSITTLQRPSEEDIEVWRRRHSVRRVMDSPLLGLWSAEHTAQLDPDALEEQEQQFRTGHRNLLASSTTMEMGIDLGGLTCVLLTNVPPGPANYWQRAGRAGRRADGSALILTLCLPRPLDQKVFLDPRAFLHSKMVPPIVRLDTEPLIRRHAHALLVARFFEDVVLHTTQGNPTNSFGRVEDFLFGPPGHARDSLRSNWRTRLQVQLSDRMVDVFLKWLESLQDSSTAIDELRDYLLDTVIARESWVTTIQRCAQEVRALAHQTQQEHQIIEQRLAHESAKPTPDRSLCAALRHQNFDLSNETLISYFAAGGFFPGFGFPLGVVRLDTRFTVNDRQTQQTSSVYLEDGFSPPTLRMERDIAIALSEYIPGHQVLADKRVYTVRGLVRNWFDEQDKVRRRFYMICKKCRHFEEATAMIARCAVCGHTTIAFDEFQSQQNAQGTKKNRSQLDLTSLSAEAPSVVRDYLIPSGFAVKLNEYPKRYCGDLRRESWARISIYGTDNLQFQEHLAGAISSAVAPAHIFIHNDGSERGSPGVGFGYCICRGCGYTVAEQDWNTKRLPDNFARHAKLRGTSPCKGESHWRHMILGSMQPVEALCFRLLGTLDPAPYTASEILEDWYLTLASLLQNAAAQQLRVDVRTLHAAVSSYECDRSFGLQAILYDTNSAGMLTLLNTPQDIRLLFDKVIHMLRHRSVADLIRFDTQFLHQQGRLRIDMLRQHFVFKERWKSALGLLSE